MNVGDSRAYLLNHQLNLLTKDQTYVQYEVDLGHLTWEQARIIPRGMYSFSVWALQMW